MTWMKHRTEGRREAVFCSGRDGEGTMATILIVEDSPNHRLLVQMELEDDGHCVIAVGNGHEALVLLRERTPDLVVLDLRLPGMDGIEVMERMLGHDRRLPVIIHSGYDYRDSFRTWPAEAYVVKNSNMDLLKAEVRRALERRAQEMDRQVV
jgi:two-component system response regulator (stage 0 sporulation protein F)